jgi:sugar lactone lactonase YvrE
MNPRWIRMLKAGVAVAALTVTPPGVLAAGRTRSQNNSTQIDDPTAGVIQTVAGGSAAGGPALDSTFFQPYGAALGSDGTLYVADTYDNQVKAVNGAGAVTVVAGTGDAGLAGDGGPARAASFNFPMGVAVGPDQSLYVADTWNDRVRRVDASTGIVTTVVGTGPNDATGQRCTDHGGPARQAVISQPHAVALTPHGDILVADTGCDVVEKVSARDGTIKVVAGIEGRSGTSGDGPATVSTLANPISVAADPLGNAVVVDTSNRIQYVNLLNRPVSLFPRASRPITVSPGYKVTIATTGEGEGPWMAGFGSDGSLLVSETTRVSRLDWATGVVSPAAGNGTAGEGRERVAPTDSPLSYPSAVFGDQHGGFIVVDRGNSRLREVTSDQLEATVAGRPNAQGPALGDGLPGTRAQLDEPAALAVGPRGIYISDRYNRRIRRLNPDGTIVTVVSAGPPCVRLGIATSDCGAGPTDRGSGLAASPAGLLAFVDAGRVSVLNDTERTATVLGSALPPGDVRPITKDGALESPAGLAFESPGRLLVTEQRANRIDRIDVATGSISDVAGAQYPASDPVTWLDGSHSVARFNQPTGIAIAKDGTIYVADTGNNRIRRIDHHGSVTTVAGNGIAGFRGDGGHGILAELAYPTDVAVNADGSVLVLDWGNERIRRVDAAGVIRTYAGSGPSRVGRRCGSTVPCGHYRGDGDLGPRSQLYYPLEGATYEALDPTGRLYIADTMNNRVRMVAVR